VTHNVDIYQTPDEHSLVSHAGLPGVASCQISFGADITHALPGEFLPPAMQTPVPLAGPGHPGPFADFPIPLAGEIVGAAWTILGPGGLYQLWLNGVAPPAWMLPPPFGLAPVGYAPMAGLGFIVAPGDQVALQFTGGPGPPGLSSVVFFIVGA